MEDAFLAGEHCSFPPCSALDFLPIPCPFCRLAFCGDHASPRDKHHCSAPSTPAPSAPDASSAGPSFKELLPDRDAAVQAERLERDRRAASELEKNARAKELLGRHFPRTSSSKTTTAKKGPLSPALQLMKLKRVAKGGDPRRREGDVPMERRWYGRVGFVEGGPPLDPQEDEGTTAVWFDKDTVAGRVLDLLESLLRVPSSPRRLALHDPLTGTDVDLSEAIGSLDQGATVWLVRP